jgi:membrane associated rhomboid family serine protease
MGRTRYIFFTLVCGFCSMLGFLLLSRNPNAMVMGYSGIIFAIFVAQASYFPENRILMFYFFPIKMKFAVFIFAAVELYLTVSPEQDGIANSAHLFGALAGWGFLKVVRRGVLRNHPEKRSVPTGAKPFRWFRPKRRPVIPREL